ncbi:MAG: MATE family efflux transporter [Clostridia bacterium]|nr:MATE family efflux transporter [Clostridia bacterium]
MRRWTPSEAEGAFSRKALIALILPLIAEQFLAVLVGMADTAMVSGVDATGSAVAAVSTVDTLNLLFINLFTAMSAGGAVVAAQYLGHRDQKNACAAAKQLMLSTLLLSTLVTAVITVFHRPIINLMDDGHDLSTLNQSYTYLLITAFSYPFLGVYNGGVGLLRAMGNSKASMWTSIAMNVINIGGNALLIHPCGLGVAGAGISTLLSRVISAGIILKVMFNDTMPIHLDPPRRRKGYFRLDAAMIRRIFRVGVPNGLENSLFQVGKVLIMGIITTFPTALRAANGICNSISSVVNIPGSAIGLATIAVIGQLIGAGKKDEARRYGKKLTALMYLSILPMNLILLLMPEKAVALLNLTPAGVPAAVTILRLYALLSIFTWVPSFGMPNILRAAGDARFTMAVSVASMLVLRLGASYLMVYGFGLSLLGVWIAMHLDWIARGVCFILRFIRGKWLDKKVI